MNAHTWRAYRNHCTLKRNCACELLYRGGRHRKTWCTSRKQYRQHAHQSAPRSGVQASGTKRWFGFMAIPTIHPQNGFFAAQSLYTMSECIARHAGALTPNDEHPGGGGVLCSQATVGLYWDTLRIMIICTKSSRDRLQRCSVWELRSHAVGITTR